MRVKFNSILTNSHPTKLACKFDCFLTVFFGILTARISTGVHRVYITLCCTTTLMDYYSL